MHESLSETPVRELRIHAVLPVRVTWTEKKHAIQQVAYTIDVSPKGARLAGLAGLEGSGQLILVRRKASEAKFRVVWVGRSRTPVEGQCGIESVDRDKIIWDVDFKKAHEDFEPVTGSLNSPYFSKASEARMESVLYDCPGKVTVWPSESDSRSIEARLSAIGFLGCKLQNGEGITLGGPVLLQICAGETQLTVKGICQEQKAWTRIEFTHIRRGDRKILQEIVLRLSAGKRV
jgi:hypothetical protein